MNNSQRGILNAIWNLLRWKCSKANVNIIHMNNDGDDDGVKNQQRYLVKHFDNALRINRSLSCYMCPMLNASFIAGFRIIFAFPVLSIPFPFTRIYHRWANMNINDSIPTQINTHTICRSFASIISIDKYCWFFPFNVLSYEDILHSKISSHSE